MLRLIFYVFSLLAFLFLASVFYMFFFLHMSFSQAVNKTVSYATNIFSTATSNIDIEVPEHLSHTPATAADNQLKRFSDSLDQ